MRAIVIGATGATGKDLLQLLLKDDSFHQVDIFVRRNPNIKHDKLITHVIDFDQPEQWKQLVSGDVLFSCLGTTLKAAGSKAAQWKVDYDYQYQFAKIARANHVNTYVLVSSDLASSSSFNFYTRMKGQLEDDVRVLGFPKLIIFNPSFLERKNTDRKLEVFTLKVLAFFHKLGILRSQKPLPTQILAQAMINTVKTKSDGAYAIKGKPFGNVMRLTRNTD